MEEEQVQCHRLEKHEEKNMFSWVDSFLILMVAFTRFVLFNFWTIFQRSLVAIQFFVCHVINLHERKIGIYSIEKNLAFLKRVTARNLNIVPRFVPFSQLHDTCHSHETGK